ncbi:MAG TPA: hypothetical protein ENN03_10225 [bacterium]|nr:hypothetical protein [bacterium]
MRKRSTVFLLAIQVILFTSGHNAGARIRKGLRVYISVDMEGIAGVCASDQVSASGRDYHMARMWTTRETNAAIQGALDAGATEILVNDSHGSMRNIIAHELNPAARLITGSPKPLGMMQGIDRTFQAALFIGYHARAGSINGVLDHTYSSAAVYSIKINGLEVGESELNAILAGHFGVPVALVAGDREVCRQVKEMLGDQVLTVEVKEGIGRHAASTLVPAEAQKQIREKTREALENLHAMKPFQLSGPYTFEIDFLYSWQADAAELIPGVERTAPRSILYTQDDFLEGFRLFRALLVLARP